MLLISLFLLNPNSKHFVTIRPQTYKNQKNVHNARAEPASYSEANELSQKIIL